MIRLGRYTGITPGGDYVVVIGFGPGHKSVLHRGCLYAVDPIIDRLAEYENTGLLPEDVVKLREDMVQIKKSVQKRGFEDLDSLLLEFDQMKDEWEVANGHGDH